MLCHRLLPVHWGHFQYVGIPATTFTLRAYHCDPQTKITCLFFVQLYPISTDDANLRNLYATFASFSSHFLHKIQTPKFQFFQSAKRLFPNPIPYKQEMRRASLQLHPSKLDRKKSNFRLKMRFFNSFQLLFLLPVCAQLLTPAISTSLYPSLTDHYGLRGRRTTADELPQEYLDPTVPDLLIPSDPADCSVLVLSHDFAHTYGLPPAIAAYSPPEDCQPPWQTVVLDLSVACAGEQYDRVAAVWLDGVELLRTTTAQPTESGIFWRVRKDVTRYAALLSRGGELSMMLENIVDEVFTGVYHVNISLDFYAMDKEEDIGLPSAKPSSFEERLGFSSPRSGRSPVSDTKVPSLYAQPADLIVPVASNDTSNGFWFRIRSDADVHSATVEIPANAYQAVLEIYVSFHEGDEFWYSNPPNVYLEKNNLTSDRGNGSFREVFATIDGRFAGSFFPFPVIFTGGINPLFWAPVVALGAFNIPSYNLDLTPLLGLLLDGKPHDIGLGITDGAAVWLVDANLHLWLDRRSPNVTAGLLQYVAPEIAIARSNVFQFMNGTFRVDAGRKAHFSGWVNSSMGNLTTDVDQKFKVKSLLEIRDNGDYKSVNVKVKGKTDVRVRAGTVSLVAHEGCKYKYPLLFATSKLPGENGTYTLKTSLSHAWNAVTSVLLNKAISTVAINDQQVADGWMLVQDHSVLNGSASTEQTYQYRDNGVAYVRKVSAKDGMLISDNSTTSPSGINLNLFYA